MTESSLAGMRAVVTGPTGDIGRALCRELATAGASLHLFGRNTDTLQQLAGSLLHLTDEVCVYTVDLTDEQSIGNAIAKLNKDASQVDILIHGAGIYKMGAQESAPVSDLDLQYQANVRGPYLVTQYLMPLIRGSRGQIVFVNSTAGLEAKKNVGQFAATQHAQRAMADSLRNEVNPDGVRVVSLYLGRTATTRQEHIFKLEGRPYSPELLIQPQDVAAMMLATLRLPRTAEVTEIRMRPLAKTY